VQLLEYTVAPGYYFYALLKLGLLGVLVAHSGLWQQPLLGSCLGLGSLLLGLGLAAIFLHYPFATAFILLGTGLVGFAYGRWFRRKQLPWLPNYLKPA
jgi:hypothetical protein